MTDIISWIQQIAALIGPNAYLQATIIAVAFIAIGKVADWIISGLIEICYCFLLLEFLDTTNI